MGPRVATDMLTVEMLTFLTLSGTTTRLHLLLMAQMDTQSQRQWTQPHRLTTLIPRPKLLTRLLSQTIPTQRPRPSMLPHSQTALILNQRLLLKLKEATTMLLP